ncbi:MAG: malto-oligosyltrehalose synthase, partial [Acidimicrobiales bacterium]
RRAIRVDVEKKVVSVGPDIYPLDAETVIDGERSTVAEVLGRQHYRLAYWRVAPLELNYRRFFDIDHLIGVRVEDPHVYEATHAFLLDLAADHRVVGLRIDHIDGLADPSGYLERLVRDLAAVRSEPATLLVEKILAKGEALPTDWPVDGTTGYEFADLSTRLFVDPIGAAAFEGLGARVTGEIADFNEIACKARLFVLDRVFPGQLDRLAVLAHEVLARREPGNDLTIPAIREALRAFIAHLNAYRSYVRNARASRADRSRLESAAQAARPNLHAEANRALDAMVETLLDAPDAQELEIRFQQLTGAVAAKGVEDTASYRYNGLLASAEVGGDPGHPSLRIDELHKQLRLRARSCTGALNALSTHDTKRSADVRARLAALSEVAPEWEQLVTRWCRRHRRVIEDAGGPDQHDQLFLFQSLAGVWPWHGDEPPAPLRDRLQAVMQKAAREAKRKTSWFDPDEQYEAALHGFVEVALGDRRLISEVERLLRRIGPAAVTNSLAMVALAATAPGVPDVYQGSEWWDLSLMDPDNRRPVAFEDRIAHLGSLADRIGSDEERSALAAELLEAWPDGRIKQLVTLSLLGLRRDAPELFADGAYLPLETKGRHRDHVVAFARRRGRRWAVTVAPRLTQAITGPGSFALGAGTWARTAVMLPDRAPKTLRDTITGVSHAACDGTLPVAEILGILPVAVLSSM